MKKILLTLVLIVSFIVSIYLVMNEKDNVIYSGNLVNAKILSHREECPDCGIEMILINANNDGAWEIEDDIECMHYPYGEDLKYQKPVIVQYMCKQCREQTDKFVVYLYRIDCHGYYPTLSYSY